MVIPREAGRATYSSNIRELKKRLVLNECQKAIVVGSILGDGCLCDNWSKTNYRLKISHSVKQRDYALWKYEALKSWVLTEPKIYDKTNSITLRTVSHPEFTDLHKMFYRNGKKVVPRNIGQMLSPLAIAVWFMDDGNIRRTISKRYGYFLNTQSFTREENVCLADMFKEKFGINCMVLTNHGKPRLYVGADRDKFSEIVKPFILPSLEYKIG